MVLSDYYSRDQQQDEGVWYYLITIVVISSRMRVCGVLPDYYSRDQQQDEGVWYYLITIVVISSRMSVCGIT